MTLDEADLSKRLLMISQAPEWITTTMVLIGIDYTKWNLSWSELVTYPFFTMLDQLFGTPNLYAQTHPFFSEAMVALASHHNPPDSLINNPRGEQGGCDTFGIIMRQGLKGCVRRDGP
jgi:hypothetical protein